MCLLAHFHPQAAKERGRETARIGSITGQWQRLDSGLHCDHTIYGGDGACGCCEAEETGEVRGYIGNIRFIRELYDGLG